MSGQGWTSRLLRGCAEHLDTEDVGLWLPSGGVYPAGSAAIVIRDIPAAPDLLVSLAAYPVDDPPGLADVTVGLQVRCRGLADPRSVEDLTDAAHEALHGLAGVSWGGVPIVQVRWQSWTSLGTDRNGRRETSSNYYVQAMRPTAHNAD